MYFIFILKFRYIEHWIAFNDKHAMIWLILWMERMKFEFDENHFITIHLI
jgi:hypothetical protein